MLTLRLYARPSGFALFRWGGEYSWIATGPVSSGDSEPLPLPTTFVGAVLGSKKGVELDEDSVLNALSEKLDCNVKALRGPYYPAEGFKSLAIHLYPKTLLVINTRGVVEGIIEQIMARSAGTALRKDSKTVVQGLLYSVSLVDTASITVLKQPLRPEVSMDVVGECNRCNIDVVVKFGGDMRVAHIACDNKPLIAELLEARGPSHRGYCIVAAPILLENKLNAERLLDGKEVILEGCKLSAVTVEEAQRMLHGEKKLIKRVRLRVEVLSPGVYGDTGFPREPLPAVMPGSLLKCECDVGTLITGVGRYSRLGFGTLIPIVQPTRQE